MAEFGNIDHGLYQSRNDKLVKADFEYLKFDKKGNEYAVTLIDKANYEIVRGFGKSIIEAINDLHSNLV